SSSAPAARWRAWPPARASGTATRCAPWWSACSRAQRSTTEMTPGERDILLVVDVQNDFIPGGALAVAGGHEVLPTINRLARAFRRVILTQAWHMPGDLSLASAHSGRQPVATTS